MDTALSQGRVGPNAAARPAPERDDPAVLKLKDAATRRHTKRAVPTFVGLAALYAGASTLEHTTRGGALDSSFALKLGIQLLVGTLLFALVVLVRFANKSAPPDTYLKALPPERQAVARRNLADATPSDDPVLRYAERKRATWAVETWNTFLVGLPLYASLFLLMNSLDDGPPVTFLVLGPVLACIGLAIIVKAKRERPQARAYLQALERTA